MIDQSAEISEVLQHFVGINLILGYPLGSIFYQLHWSFCTIKTTRKTLNILLCIVLQVKMSCFWFFLFLQRRTCHTIYHHSMSQQALVYLKQVLWNLSSILFLVYKIKFYSVKYCGLRNTVNGSCLFLSHGTTVPQKSCACTN